MRKPKLSKPRNISKLRTRLLIREGVQHQETHICVIIVKNLAIGPTRQLTVGCDNYNFFCDYLSSSGLTLELDVACVVVIGNSNKAGKLLEFL
jgi:hypothetical protein